SDSAAASPSAPASASPARSSTTVRKASPAPTVVLGTLSYSDLVAYCQDTNSGMAWPPGHNHDSWTCLANHNQRQDFSPTDVCQWRYHDGTARAQVGDLNDPTTWRCRG
ncbi:MAG TPA: hypothetical protein VJT31_05810, partial [Rugosimonospora sp.]|nr:hypothetical protein [Rugosimonospora sp.]